MKRQSICGNDCPDCRYRYEQRVIRAAKRQVKYPDYYPQLMKAVDRLIAFEKGKRG